MINEGLYQSIDFTKVIIQPLNDAEWQTKNIAVHVLRLDRIHPVVSGNKWFKLKYHLQQALQQHKKGICTFGGAWSNHLVATAFACRQAGLASIGIIRGEQPALFSATLQDAQQYGMQLQFISRTQYANRAQLPEAWQQEYPDYYIVPQGGQSHYGVQGAAEIWQTIPQAQLYSHIACAIGTGTMLAGVVKASLPHQRVIGISSLKIPSASHNSINTFVKQQTNNSNFTIYYDYHFGGYARKTDELIRFMNQLYQTQHLPTDFVYTGKLLYAVINLIHTGYFAPGSRLLVIHSGGLQGNRSLPAGTLTFL